MTLPKPVLIHTKLKHKISVIPTAGTHYGYYKCVNCDKWLAWASKHTETPISKLLQPKPRKAYRSQPSIQTRYKWHEEFIQLGLDRSMPFSHYLKKKTKEWLRAHPIKK
jgi:hypothetical protein